MPNKGYKQRLEHIRKAAERRGKLVGRNNPAYIVVNGSIRKQIIDSINSRLSVSQISTVVGLSKYIIKRVTKEECKDVFDRLLINNREFISLSKLGSLNPMKKLENILKRKEKINYELIGRKISKSRKELFREGKLKHWNKIYPLHWEDLLTKYKKRMKENNPMFNSDIVRKVIDSQRTKGIYEKSRARMRLLWRDPYFRKGNIERLKTNNPMRREEVIIKNWKSHKHRPTDIERKFMKLINVYNLPIEYVGNAQFFIGYKNPDFKVINQNKVIEITSDAYGRTIDDYSNSTIDYYRKRGYDCLVIWSNCRRYKDELKNENLDETLLKIKNFINYKNEVKVNFQRDKIYI